MQTYLGLLKCDPAAAEAVAGVAALSERWHVPPAAIAHALCLHLDSCTGLNPSLEPDDDNPWSILAGEPVHSHSVVSVERNFAILPVCWLPRG